MSSHRVPPCPTLLIALALLAPPELLAAESPTWTFGLGTGLQRLNVSGDVGFSSARGPEIADIDLSPDDFKDLMKSAIGLQAFATKGKWQVALTYANLELEDKARIAIESLPALPALNTRFRQEIAVGELTVAYQVAELAGNRIGVQGGVRTTRHDYDLLITGSPGTLPGDPIATQVSRSLDDDWTDALVGLTHSLDLTENLRWSSSAVAGFGDSDSYWSARTAVAWQPGASPWLIGAYIDFRSIDFENGTPGEPGWYLYDADEWGPGITISYVFR